MDAQLPTLKPIYSWSNIAKFEVGPRREITLFMRLWRRDILNRHEHNWKQNREPAIIAPVRFGGVENLEEVQAFFQRIEDETAASSPSAIAQVDFFGYDSSHTSKPGDIYFRVYFDRTGDKVVIRCQNITEQESFSEDE